MTHVNSNRHHAKSATRRRGYTLMQMVIVLPLLGVFMVAGSQLFLLNNTMLKQSAAEHERLGRIDGALHRLRLDTLAAGEPPLVGDESVLFQDADNLSEVSWQSDDAGDLTRTTVSGGEPEIVVRRYTGLGETRFEEVPGGIVLVLHNERYLCPFGQPHSEDQP